MPQNTITHAPGRKTRLADSAYLSPYSHAGAPSPHPNTDAYASLRARALPTLEAMGYDPSTMAERGVTWAEDQDPFGHVMQSQYMHFLGTCFHHVMEGYNEFLSEQEYNDMIHGKTVVPALRRYELDIRRQVKYPDSVRNFIVLTAPDTKLFAQAKLTWRTAHRGLPAGPYRANAKHRNNVALFAQATGYCRPGQRLCDLHGCQDWSSRRHPHP